MFKKAAVSAAVPCTQHVRGMATLRDINNRLKAVTNIQKITASMKVVSAAKYAKAEKELASARSYGGGASAFYEKAEITHDEKKPNHLIIALSSDKGLCGGVHANIVRAIKANLPKKAQGVNTKFIAVGDKPKGILARFFKSDILMHFADVGKKPPTFGDASVLTDTLLNLEYEFDVCELYYNKFRTVLSYTTTVMPLYNDEAISNSDKLLDYDSIDEDVLRDYKEFSLASLMYFASKEAACSEQSARMSSMDSATKNAGEVIESLQLLYNRKRQAVITTELIEIISGAAALE